MLRASAVLPCEIERLRDMVFLLEFRWRAASMIAIKAVLQHRNSLGRLAARTLRPRILGRGNWRGTGKP